MSKYSIQNECLEMIEAFSDEQMTSEMSVIESVLDIFEKTVLMMELSNSDVDIPDCSMFMESTFFQEVDGEPAGGDANTAPPTNNAEAAKPAENKVPTEEERKKYNSQNQFRQMNKKGKIENIFISIITFIPRFLGFLIQCLVKLVKKITNKDKTAAETVKNATPEEKAKVAEELKSKEGTTEDGIKIVNGRMVAENNSVWCSLAGDGSGVASNIDDNVLIDAISKTLDGIKQVTVPEKLESDVPVVAIDIKLYEQKVAEANKRKAETQAIIDAETRERQRASVLKALKAQLTELQRCQATVNNAIENIKRKQAGSTEGSTDWNIYAKRITARKQDLTTIKGSVTTVTRWISEYESEATLTDALITKYAGYLETAKKKVDTANTYSNDAVNAMDAGVREKGVT